MNPGTRGTTGPKLTVKVGVAKGPSVTCELFVSKIDTLSHVRIRLKAVAVKVSGMQWTAKALTKP